MHTHSLNIKRAPMGLQTSTRGPSSQHSRKVLRCAAVHIGKNDPRLWTVKQCIDQAVLQVFEGHATVQLQGSTAKSTSLRGSDWDFIVRMNDNIVTATDAQRKALRDQLQAQLSAAGIHYDVQLGENRIQLKHRQEELPKCDIVLQRFKDDVRVPPNNKALAGSHTAQKVVRYVKALPNRYNHLPKLKSSMLEEAVMLLDSHMRCQLGLSRQDMEGNAAVDRLLTATLQAVAGIGSMQAVQGVQASLQQAGVNGEWESVAPRLLKFKAEHKCWSDV